MFQKYITCYTLKNPNFFLILIRRSLGYSHHVKVSSWWKIRWNSNSDTVSFLACVRAERSETHIGGSLIYKGRYRRMCCTPDIDSTHTREAVQVIRQHSSAKKCIILRWVSWFLTLWPKTLIPTWIYCLFLFMSKYRWSSLRDYYVRDISFYFCSKSDLERT